jgi:putative endonuclease
VKWYVYILECQNGAFYTGFTDDLKRRFYEHVTGKGGAYTGRNRPKMIIYSEIFDNKLSAEIREKQIKRWSRSKKSALIQNDLTSLHNLSVSRE